MNGKIQDLNAEEIYSVLTTPVFGKDVIYDVPNAKFMEQKKFLKSGLTTERLRSYVTLMKAELEVFFKASRHFKGSGGLVNLPPIMAQVTLFTAARSLQGSEVRDQLDTTFGKLFHDLDDGFQPINFMLPGLPLPVNRRRDRAQQKMTELYTSIIRSRREKGTQSDSQDMIANLMDCAYKDGTPLPEHEIAHLMIGLLMAGQHNTSVTSCWIMLHLAAEPEVQEEIWKEQKDTLGDTNGEMTWDQIQRMTKLKYVIQESLRMHPTIHSIMRKVKRPMPIDGTPWVVPPGHVLLASPAMMGKSEEFFANADKWDPKRWVERKEEEEKDEETMDYGFGLVNTGANSTVPTQ